MTLDLKYVTADTALSNVVRLMLPSHRVLGTSLTEPASSVIAARKGEHDIALGNILGSNLFNTLAVVGIAVRAIARKRLPIGI